MSKELEALKEIVDFENELHSDFSIFHKRNLEIIEKSLKALEIIKEKEVVIPILIRSNTLDEYNNNPMFVSKKLTKEEYDLLKEVLK